MEDSRPQDVHFAWDDIMDYKNVKAPKHGKKPARHLSISEYPSDRNQKDYQLDSDVEAWSETESNYSTGRSSIAESHSTRTTVSFAGIEDHFDEDDHIDFPSYDDVNHSRKVSDLCEGVAALPSLGSAEVPDSCSLETIEHAEDDVAICVTPSRHVDYLSHDWCEEDIWSSWKHLKSKRKVYSKMERLENAAWRIWEKERQNLPTITPESINWMKDRDVTWLYGPFQTVAKELDLCYTSGAPVSFASQTTESSLSNVRPILKKRTLSEALLQRSVSSTSIAKQALSSQDQASDVDSEPSQLTTDDSAKNSVRFASTSTVSDQDSTTTAKNVRFHHEVEQYMAVGDEVHDDSENKNDSEDMLELKLNKKSSTWSSSTPESPAPKDSENESKIIVALPKTTLKATEEKPQPAKPADKPASWTPSSYWFDTEKGTVSELEPSSTRATYDGDDEEEDWIESFTPNEVQDEAHRRRFMLISGGDSTPGSRDPSPDGQYQSGSASHNSNSLVPAVVSRTEAEMEKSSSGAESDLDSDSQSTSDTSIVESDDTSSDDSGYGYIDSSSNERFSQGSAVGFILDPVRQDMVNRIMDEFWTLFDQNWDTNFTECTASSASSSESGVVTSTPSSSAPSQQIQRKRQRLDDDDDDDGPEDNKDRKSRQPRRLPAPGGGARFACPFRKNNPRQYNIYNNRVCALSHWQSIARVKEHLYRCHQIGPHCKRCWRTFKTQQQLDSHITVAANEICEVRLGSAPAGISPAIERQLRSRKKSHPNQTDEERWKDIYKLLFPNEEVPSPYFEAIQADSPSSPDSRELANYEDYIRRELPRLVRSNIEEVVRRETQPLEAALIGSLVGIIQDCQDRVFRAYRESHGVDAGVVTEIGSPSEDTASSPPPLPPTWAEDWASDGLPLQSNLLDAAFETPLRIQQTAPDYLGFGRSVGSEPAPFSDSGYASEPRCNCKEPCNCPVSGLNIQIQSNLSGPLRGSNGSWNESTPYPSWHEVDANEDEAALWMNI